MRTKVYSSAVQDADLLLVAVFRHPGDDGGKEGAEISPQPRSLVLNVNLQLSHS